MISIILLIVGFISLVSGQCSTTGKPITATGIVMDNYCIQRGTLLDKPSIKTLEKPYEHTIHCLIDIPQCIDSEYTLLLPPKAAGGLWTVDYQLGKEGTQLIIEEAKKLRERGVKQNLTLTLSGVIESVNGNSYLRCIKIIESSGSNASGSASVNVQLFRAAHGALMFLAWIVLTPLGILIARYYKHLGHRWYIYHVGIQLTACLLTLVSGILIFYSMWPSTTFDDRNGRAAFAHATIGMIILVGAVIVQPMLGKYADYLYRKQSNIRLAVPTFPDKIHWWLGRLLAILAIINVWIGIGLFDTGMIWWILVGAIVLIVHAVLHFINEISKRTKGTEDRFIEMSHRQQ